MPGRPFQNPDLTPFTPYQRKNSSEDDDREGNVSSLPAPRRGDVVDAGRGATSNRSMNRDMGRGMDMDMGMNVGRNVYDDRINVSNHDNRRTMRRTHPDSNLGLTTARSVPVLSGDLEAPPRGSNNANNNSTVTGGNYGYDPKQHTRYTNNEREHSREDNRNLNNYGRNNSSNSSSSNNNIDNTFINNKPSGRRGVSGGNSDEDWKLQNRNSNSQKERSRNASLDHPTDPYPNSGYTSSKMNPDERLEANSTHKVPSTRPPEIKNKYQQDVQGGRNYQATPSAVPASAPDQRMSSQVHRGGGGLTGTSNNQRKNNLDGPTMNKQPNRAPPPPTTRRYGASGPGGSYRRPAKESVSVPGQHWTKNPMRSPSRHLDERTIADSTLGDDDNVTQVSSLHHDELLELCKFVGSLAIKKFSFSDKSSKTSSSSPREISWDPEREWMKSHIPQDIVQILKNRDPSSGGTAVSLRECLDHLEEKLIRQNDAAPKALSPPFIQRYGQNQYRGGNRMGLPYRAPNAPFRPQTTRTGYPYDTRRSESMDYSNGISELTSEYDQSYSVGYSTQIDDASSSNNNSRDIRYGRAVPYPQQRVQRWTPNDEELPPPRFDAFPVPPSSPFRGQQNMSPSRSGRKQSRRPSETNAYGVSGGRTNEPPTTHEHPESPTAPTTSDLVDSVLYSAVANLRGPPAQDIQGRVGTAAPYQNAYHPSSIPTTSTTNSTSSGNQSQHMAMAPSALEESDLASAPSLAGSTTSSDHRSQSGSSHDLPFGHSRSVNDGIHYQPQPFADHDLIYLCRETGTLATNAELTEEDYANHDRSWNPVRDWIQSHSAEELLTSLQYQDSLSKNVFHVACKHQPPIDVIEYWLKTLRDASGGVDELYNDGTTRRRHVRHSHSSILELQDRSGWTPLHYACAFASAPKVLRMLAESCLNARDKQTNEGMTPLHLALIGPFREYSDLIATLASKQACKTKDVNDVLPLHYACGFGASEETIRVLASAYEKSLVSMDKNGQYPLHFALTSVAITPTAAPTTVRLLMRLRPDIFHKIDQEQRQNAATTQHPIDFLQETAVKKTTAGKLDDEPIKASLQQCLSILLETGPNISPRVLTTIRRLPRWMFQTAISSPHVQRSLNEKIKGKFPTLILMMDLLIQFSVLVFFEQAARQALGEECSQGDGSGFKFQPAHMLFLGAIYFLVREVVQVYSLIRLRSFKNVTKAYTLQASDVLNFVYIALTFGWAVIIQNCQLRDDRGITGGWDIFQDGLALSAGILWMKLFLFFRGLSIDFSVFITGFFYVADKLFPYMVGLACFFLAFTQIFYTVFLKLDSYACELPEDIFNFDETCPGQAGTNDIDICVGGLDDKESLGFDLSYNIQEYFRDRQCSSEDRYNPFCDRRRSLLKVITMFLGEVNEEDFESSPVATWYFVIFMFMMVLLLPNVLIAIVTNSYKYIQDEEAEAVFYTNRLIFLAEAEVIRSFPLFWLGIFQEDNKYDTILYQGWKQLILNFHMSPYDSICSRRFFAIQFFRMLFSLFVIPIWIIIGFVTCGMLWPPQIREWLFTDSRKRTMAQRESEFSESRKREEKRAKIKLEVVRDGFLEGLVTNRTQMIQIKTSLQATRYELSRQMKHLTTGMTTLFERVDHHEQQPPPSPRQQQQQQQQQRRFGDDEYR